MEIGRLYVATNTKTNKVYVGQTRRDVRQRMLRHFRDAKKGSPLRFHQALRKHGEDAFDFREVAVGPAGDWLNAMEIALIAAYGSFGRGYNSSKGGDGIVGSQHLRGRPRSAETRARISAAQKEVWKDRPGTFLGRKHTPEAIEKIRLAHLGKKASAEARANMSAAHVGKHHAGTFAKGYKHPEAARQKMSEDRKGVPKTGVGLDNIRRGAAKRIGSKASDEARANLSAAILAMPMVKCPHCEVSGRARGGMFRYHFDNCKKRGAN